MPPARMWGGALAAWASAFVALVAPGFASAGTVPAGFEDAVVFSGLTDPTSVRFAADGRVFVAEKSGLIKVFDSLSDPSPTVFADLSTNVYNFWDRGLLGLALDPRFTDGRPYVYVLYSYDAAIGGLAPRWGTPGLLSDPCPTPPGATGDGCIVSGRVSRLTANGNVAVGGESVLIEDWCQQYPSHSIGSLAFGADGALYVSGGDGASFNFVDYGQDGNPLNPCGDPPGGVGALLAPPSAEGGALRSQDLRTTADPTSLDGAILRVDPNTGNGMPDNPNAGSPDPNARRIIGHGLRNPFRITVRPGTNEVWAGDVGWNTWEEINRLPAAPAPVTNFGWPCYEGVGRQSGYDGANLSICETLYGQGGAVTAPFFTYDHAAKIVTGETCPTGSSSISGLAFYNGGTFPSNYNGALFFADYSRNCIWVMFAGQNGLPDPATRQTFDAGASGPVDLQLGPGGALYYADLNGDTIRRIRALNGAPSAVISAVPTSGAAPLTVQFDGTGSTDPDGDALSYAWDLDGDGAYDDSTAARPSWTYSVGNYTARLTVSDARGGTGTASVAITAGTPPVPVISTPAATLQWKVGDTIGFSGSATDAEDGGLPAARLSWRLVLQHCSGTCHAHVIQDFVGVSSGSFAAPDHEYPSYLELTLTATDSSGLSRAVTRRLDPRTVDLTLESQPAGLALSLGSETSTAPFTRTVIQGSANTIIASSPQTIGSTSYQFSSWSDGGAATHTVVAPATATTYRATYAAAGQSGLVGAWGFDEPSGTTANDSSGNGNSGTLSGPTRSTAGKFGSALTFDGVNDSVRVSDSNSLDLSSRATLEAWIFPTALGGNWRTALLKSQPNQLVYALYANTDTGRPSGHVFTTGDIDTRGTTALPLNAWTHLAATYDGATLRLYVNGTQVSSRAQTGPITTSAGELQIGGNTVWGEWFAGLLDEIRVYDRTLSATEIQSDMATPVGGLPPPDTQPPTAPTSLGATGGMSSVALSWTAATDNVGIHHYDVHRSTVAPVIPTTANRIAQVSGTTYADNGLAAGVFFYRVVAYDAAGNPSPSSNEVSATVTGDTSAPTAAITAPAEGAAVAATVTVTASASDNIGVAGVQFFANGTAIGSEDTAAPYSVSWSTTTAADGPYSLTARARDAAGNPGTSGPVHVVVDNTPPAVAITAPGEGASVLGTATFTASASDSVGVAGVQFLLNGAPIAPEDTSAPYLVSWDSTSVANGLYTLTARARDTAGNQPISLPIHLTVDNPVATGLVAAYGFNEGTGATANDGSGKANTGTISGPAWSTAGKFGGALSFDGVNDLVTVADSNTLDLTTGMTLEGWFFPTALGGGWRTGLLKEQPGQLVYALYANEDTSRPSGHVYVGGDRDTRGTASLPLNAWTHLAATYDGATLRLYANGAQVSTRAQTGSIATSAGALRMGGNNVWGEWFAGRLDEIRVYSRALSAAEIQADMNRPIP